MIRRTAQLARQLRERITRLPRAALAGLAAVVVAAVAVGGVLMYRTYDYVQHDNNFCMSCHLMADPFDRFARSEHRGLGCKACHQPTMAVRTQMALTQILENPDEIQTHAEVPNEACAGCHVDGNPSEWQLISASAGHRVHLESEDPKLRGLTCVQCHSSSVHEFSTTDKTCGQSDCHETTEVKLGRMGALTIHCASCHEFNRPVSTAMSRDTLAVALRPQREQCLSCHAMRNLVADFPEHDAHSGACGACHDPHEQTTPAQAVESCATAGCHARSDTITPFHRGLTPSVLSQCTQCHTAHEFKATTECSQCHQSIPRTVVATSIGSGGGVSFQHTQHANVDCASCHQTTQTHGAVSITSFAECRACHHTGSVAQTCTRCHQSSEITGVRQLARPVRIAATAPETRRLPFNHDQHRAEACSACHASNAAQSAANVSCTSCHEKHHQPNANCRACHETPPRTAHTAQAHLTCAGAGCHSNTGFRGVPRTRQLCLSCHQTMVDHFPGRTCADCHALPPPRGGGGDDPAHGALRRP